MNLTLDPIRLTVVAGLVLTLVAALLVHRRTRTTWCPRRRTLDPRDLPVPLTEPLTLVSFAGRLCSDCKEVPHVAVAGAPELPLVELSVTDRPDLVRHYGIREVPSLVLVDIHGRILHARQGLPDAAELWQAMRPHWDTAWAAHRQPKARHAAVDHEASTVPSDGK